jgi:putative endonuclease
MNTVRAFHYVYVLQNASEAWYIGCTSDLRRRVHEHLSGKSTYTKHSGPYELIYYEASMSSEDAFARERYLKSGMGRRYLKNRLNKQLKGALTV